MSSRILSNSRAGFTLLEVLVSMAIMAMIMIMIWSTQSQSLNSKDRIEKRDMAYQYGRVALNKVANDLTMAFLAKKPGTAAAAAAETGTAPAAATIEISTQARPVTFFIGEDNGERDSVRFTSFSHMRLYSGAKESDQCKVKYEVAPSADEQGKLNLVRSELPWLDGETDVKSTPLVLAENIRNFELEYYDDRKDEWGKEWNTEIVDFAGRLPKAVKIKLALIDPDDEEKNIELETMVMVPMSTGVLDF